MLVLDEVQTVAFGGLSLFAGFCTLRLVPVLKTYNVPAPVIGGLLVALVMLLAHHWNVTLVTFDTRLQNPLMVAFFTTIGFNASLTLLKVSGRQVALLLGVAAAFSVLQSFVGMGVAVAFGLHPLFGVLAGAATLAGGPATGLAFAPLFEQAGVTGAASIAVAAAMAGIISGGLAGGPVATWLVRRHRLKPSHDVTAVPAVVATEVADAPPTPLRSLSEHQRLNAILKGSVILLSTMWLGSCVSAGIVRLGVTLPPYIGAMLVGALIRNIDDRTDWIGLPRGVIEDIGSICLAFFLSMALMNLKLWELSGLALPLLLNLAVQIVLVAAFCVWPLFQLMGRDYDSAVMSGGFVGFMLGITANAMAVMRTLVERYGPAPRAFLVAPLVGAFFIDFTNALVITTFINLLG